LSRGRSTYTLEVVRQSAREKYTQELSFATRLLSAFRQRFEALQDSADLQQCFGWWQGKFGESIQRYRGFVEGNRFEKHYNLDREGADGGYLLAGIDSYERYLADALEAAPTLDLTYGYDEDVRPSVEQIDDLIDHVKNLRRRNDSVAASDYQVAAHQMRQWRRVAAQTLARLVGKDAAELLRELRVGNSLEEQYDACVKFLLDLKEDIQKYPHHLIALAEPVSTGGSGAIDDDRRIFVVHGHGLHKDVVARTLSTLGLQPIILLEQPGAGQTLIEKFEHHADARYAIVVLAADDVGGKVGEEQERRARQNVIFELGYFVGKLGRGRVCVLYQSGVQIPSDYLGVEYVIYDESDAWKIKLARELKHAGYPTNVEAL